MNLESTLADLQSPQASQRSDAYAALRRLGSPEVDQILKLAAQYRHKRRLWTYFVNSLLIADFTFLYACVSGHFLIYNWPIAIRLVTAAVPILILYPASILLTLRGRCQGYRPMIEALAIVETDNPDVVECLIDGLRYDWKPFLTTIIAAIGRHMAKIMPAEIPGLHAPQNLDRLWCATLNGIRSRIITIEQAEDIGRVLIFLVERNKKEARKRLKMLSRLPKQKVKTDAQIYLETLAGEQLQRILSS